MAETPSVLLGSSGEATVVYADTVCTCDHELVVHLADGLAEPCQECDCQEFRSAPAERPLVLMPAGDLAV